METWTNYRRASPPLRELGLACLGAGEQEGLLPPVSRRTLSCHALVVVSQGTGWLNYAGQNASVTAPSLIWIFPGVEHGYGPGTSGWREHWVLFAGASARAFEELGCYSRDRPLATLQGDDGMLALFTDLRHALAVEGPRGDLDSSVAAQQIIVGASRRGRQLTAGIAETTLARLRELAYLPLGAGQQAARLGLTPQGLREIVQAAAGVGPKEFVLQLRTSRAQSLLADTDFPIERVARLTGYDDGAYFSRLFSQRVGLSPSHFRLQHRRSGGGGSLD
ncbi:AraC family transcriptional regulator [Arthrobacter sp. 24S4-2]|uniref:AraC family transcriptional regulator n=1 Tax=Arthrobacter sp. 24S4-2 TaxID=2575374 RepID=UPI0010C793BA|nr:AraC family transcriptional regulator [Arthrobacter sp. 24S4-2]QCO96727.1 AraC family transcriptional regulator [Arthrobacter sp. 24S4-2]